MENEIKELIANYAYDLQVNETLYPMVESSTLTKYIIKDLQSLLKLYQAQQCDPKVVKEIPTIHDIIYQPGEK